MDNSMGVVQAYPTVQVCNAPYPNIEPEIPRICLKVSFSFLFTLFLNLLTTSLMMHAFETEKSVA
jgi:hypothetical protein